MEYLIVFAVVIGFVMFVSGCAIVWACCAVAKTSDDAMEKWSHQ